jgi:hypothetical protein
MALCPDCDGIGRTLVTFGLLRDPSGKRQRLTETVALRECAVCDGRGWFRAGPGR